MVQFNPSTTDDQIGNYMETRFQTKAQIEKFSGAALRPDYALHRVLVSWPKAWSQGRQQAFIQYLASSPEVERVARA